MIRLIFFIVMIAAVVTGYRWWRGQRSLASGPARDLDRARRELATKESTIRDAIALVDQILEVELDEAERAAIRTQVEAVVQQLADQVEMRARIDRALAEEDVASVDREIAAVAERIEAAEGDTKAALLASREGLLAQQQQIERLRRRRELLETSAAQILVELRSLHLAMLDAVASRAELGSERVHESRKNLAAASSRLEQQVVAEAELTRLIRG